jgi:WD40 repeat protein
MMIGGSGAGNTYPSQGAYIIATTNNGMAVRVDVAKALLANKQKSKSLESGQEKSAIKTGVKAVLFYHDSTLYALAVSPNMDGLFATGGDDRRVCIWNSHSRSLLTRWTSNVRKLNLKIRNLKKYYMRILSNSYQNRFADYCAADSNFT